ncbi:MAG TPA: class I SAM-dependent methyltransferase, partial [Anaerolineae bacterium]|nr:class I SAM-dependent methyltransferase [Anaerolineae bacterium]
MKFGRKARGTQVRKLRSCQCTQAQLQSADFSKWIVQMLEKPDNMHRKLWEFGYITQALHERGMLSLGKRGLGFAVGTEPLPDLFASMGCDILASDLDTEEAKQKGWVDTSQHASSLELLNKRKLCPPDLFRERVDFRFIDMRELPNNLGMYDFIWSSCSLEHLGTLELGEKFIYDSLKYLKPDGVAVHTTEYNVQSNSKTISEGASVIYRKRDFKRMAKKLRKG